MAELLNSTRKPFRPRLVRELAQVTGDPARVCREIRGRFGLPLLEPKPLYEPQLLSAGRGGFSRCLVELAAPGSLATYHELCALAEYPEAASDQGLESDLEAAFSEWERQCRARTDEREENADASGSSPGPKSGPTP